MRWSQNLLVGLLFSGALFLVGYFTIISESGPVSVAGRSIVVFFDNVEGVREGTPVTVLGVPAGTVSRVELVAVDADRRAVTGDLARPVGQRVALTVELKRNVVFYDNYSINITNASLLSGKVIAIDPGSADVLPGAPIAEKITVFTAPPTLPPGETALTYLLKQRQQQNFAELQGDSAGDPIAGLSELISENRSNLRATIQNVRDITEKINRGQGTLGILINDDELHRNASTLLTDAEIVVRELRESLEDTREQAPVTSFVRAALTAW